MFSFMVNGGNNIMKELAYLLLNNIVITFLSFIILFLFFIGLFWKRIIEKEKDFIKRVNNKFFLKYVILSILIIGTIFVIVGYILDFINISIGKYLMFGSFSLLFISVEWAYLFDKINIFADFSKDEIIEQYISFFARKKMSNIKFLEIITWFSRWNHKIFRTKSDDIQETDKLIIKLELLLRPNKNGLCLASFHKKVFLELCIKLKDNETREELKEIEHTAKKMEESPVEKYKIFSLSFDRNILFYLSIIALHIAASILISDDIKNVFGNILFYIPSDILLVLVYKGIISEREENRK